MDESGTRRQAETLTRTTMEKILMALGIVVGFPLLLFGASMAFASFVSLNSDTFRLYPWVADWAPAGVLALVVGIGLVGGVFAYDLYTEAEFEREKRERDALERAAAATAKKTAWLRRARGHAI